MAEKKRKVKPVYRKLLMIVMLAASCFLLLESGKDIALMFKLQQQNKDLQVELDKLEEEHNGLISQQEKLEDDGYIQAYARGNYMFSKDGEQIFYLPSVEK